MVGRRAPFSGFTLSEMLIATAVVSVVIGLVFQLIIGTTDVSRDLRARIELQSQAPSILNKLAADLRSAREVTVEDSGDPARPHVRIADVSGARVSYHWDADKQDYFRHGKNDDWRKLSPTGLLIEGLGVADERGLARITLGAGRRVSGTTRTVRIELSTQVQTLQ